MVKVVGEMPHIWGWTIPGDPGMESGVLGYS